MAKKHPDRKSKKNQQAAFILFDVLYEDDSRSSNRRVPAEAFGPFEEEEDVARAVIEAQDREIAGKSGRPRGSIKSIKRSPNQ